jgi:hypothetical protein
MIMLNDLIQTAIVVTAVGIIFAVMAGVIQ